MQWLVYPYLGALTLLATGGIFVGMYARMLKSPGLMAVVIDFYQDDLGLVQKRTDMV